MRGSTVQCTDKLQGPQLSSVTEQFTLVRGQLISDGVNPQ